MSEREEEPEDDFPLGDGAADTEAEVQCPYCGEVVEIVLDPAGGMLQEYVEDCQVCCRPWQVRVNYQADGRAIVSLESDDEE